MGFVQATCFQRSQQFLFILKIDFAVASSTCLTQLPHLLSKNTSKLGSKEREVVDNIMFYFNISKIVTNRLIKL